MLKTDLEVSFWTLLGIRNWYIVYGSIFVIAIPDSHVCALSLPWMGTSSHC
jgi:hypothetical protein